MSEAKIIREKGPETLIRGPGFETPLLRGSLFNMNPFALMRRFTEDMDRMFIPTALGKEELETWSPVVEVKEINGKFLVSAELPGLKREEVKVHVTPEALILEGERKLEKEEKKEGYYHTERSYGHFYRSIPLPEEVNLEKAYAEFTNGVLEVSIPVTGTKHKPREVPVFEGGKVKTAGG